MKRATIEERPPLPAWKQKKAAAAQGLRELPRCTTPGCEGRQLGLFVGSTSTLCAACQQKRRIKEKSA